MFLSPSVLLLATSALSLCGYQQDIGIAKGPYEMRGEVLDVFDGKRLLLSIGKDQGAFKGLKGFLVRKDPDLSFFYECEFAEVGARHSVIGIKPVQSPPYHVINLATDGFILRLAPKMSPLQEKDRVFWYSVEPRPLPDYFRGNPSRPGQKLRESLLSRPPGYMESGGAIIIGSPIK